MQIHFLSILSLLLLTTIVLANKDLRQSAVFSANSNPYQNDQLSLNEQDSSNGRIAHLATPSSQNSIGGFGQDVQGKQFGQTGGGGGALNSFGFGASGSSADSSSSYAAYPVPQKPASYPDSSSGGYTSSVNSYSPPPSVGGGYPSNSNNYAPPASLGGYPASVGTYPTSQVNIQHPKAQYGQPATTGESYAYHYQHYPQQSHHQHSDYGTDVHSHTQSHSLFDGDLFSGLSGFGGDEGGLGGGGGIAAAAGLKALKALKGLSLAAKIAKHVLLVKPFIILGLLLLVLLPFIILFFPIPIITIANEPAADPAGGGGRANTQEIFTTYLSELTTKVLNAEECLERIVCKMPEVPEKYRGKAKGLWEEFGLKYITNTRVTRGMSAYFDDKTVDPSKTRSFKCDQKFKCSNKFF